MVRLNEELLIDTLRTIKARLVDRSRSANLELPALEKEVLQLRSELARLVDAIAKAETKPDVMLQGIAERQERLSALDARIRAAEAAPGATALPR